MCSSPHFCDGTPSDCWACDYDDVSTVCNDCGYQAEQVFDTCPNCGAEDVWQGVLP